MGSGEGGGGSLRALDTEAVDGFLGFEDLDVQFRVVLWGVGGSEQAEEGERRRAGGTGRTHVFHLSNLEFQLLVLGLVLDIVCVVGPVSCGRWRGREGTAHPLESQWGASRPLTWRDSFLLVPWSVAVVCAGTSRCGA